MYLTLMETGKALRIGLYIIHSREIHFLIDFQQFLCFCPQVILTNVTILIKGIHFFVKYFIYHPFQKNLTEIKCISKQDLGKVL